MRNIRPIKGITRLASLLAICGLLVLAGCRNPTQPSIATENGTLSLTIEMQSTERAIMPTTTIPYDEIRLSFADSRNPGNTLSRIWGEDPVTLPVGTWDMRATAYLKDAEGDPTLEMARSVWIRGIVVAPGQTTTLSETVTLLPIPEGEGMFRWDIGFPASAVRAEMEVREIDGDGYENETPYWYDDFDLTDPELDGTLAGETPLPAGTYRFFLTLINAQGEATTIRSVLHVWHNMESVFVEEFTPGIFPITLFAYVIRAWDGTEWDFTALEIRAGDFPALLDIHGVDTDNFHADDDTGIIYWLNTLTYNDGDPIVPGNMDDFRALVDAALIGIGADEAFRAEDSHASRQALEQAARAFALNETPVWFSWSANNRVIAHVGDNAGIYYSIEIALADEWRIPLTVTFDSAGGTPVYNQAVREGNPVPEPVDPTKTLIPAAGLWLGTLPLDETPLNFEGWECEAGDLWTFDTTVTENITLTARWSTAPATRVETVPANNIEAAIAHANANPATFTLAINQDVTSGQNQMHTDNVHLTIVGLDEPRKIRFSTGTGGDRLFDVGATAVTTGTSLTLGENITLVGRTIGLHYQTANSGTALIRVRLGGRLYMDDDSKITGHTSTSTTGAHGSGAAVHIYDRGTFTMRGGTITGNRAINTGTNAAAGVSVAVASSRFYMEGGNITGNHRGVNTDTPPPADVLVASLADHFTISGNATVSSLVLAAYSTYNAFVTIGADGWEGSVDHLTLRWNSGTLSTVINNWTGNTVLEAVYGHTLTAADAGRLGTESARFIGSNENTWQDIDYTHAITVREDNLTGFLRRILFNVTFDSAGGSSVPTQPVRENNHATAPANPTRVSAQHDIDITQINAAGLWAMTYGFDGWQRREGDTLQPWSFDTPITGDTTLVAVWNTADPTPARIEAVEVDDTIVSAAVAHVNANPGRYVLAINAAAESSGNQLQNDGAHLTIIGLDGRQTITLTDTANNQRLFDIGTAALVTGDGSASLTIGNNITLVGRDGNTVSLVRVRDNARLYMLPGSEIRGHIHSGTGTGSGSGSAVHIAAHGMFTMSGGTISENIATGGNATNTAAVGGVTLYTATARFDMTGGIITGNFRGDGDDLHAADVGLGNAVTNFTMSGDAALGHLNLNANANNTAFVNIGAGGWEGRVDHLTLRWNNTSLSTVINNWVRPPPEGRTVIRGTLDQDIIDRFGYTSVRFIGINNTPTHDIADSHEIAIENGAGVVRAIPSVTVIFLDGSGGNEVDRQTMLRGRLATEPTTAPATRTWLPIGLWVYPLPGSTQLTFVGWQHNGTPWNFDTNTVNYDKTLIVRWSDPPETPVAGIDADGNIDVPAAVAHANANAAAGRRFVLAIDRHVYSGPTPNLAANNADLLIYGHGEPREIRFTSTAPANNERLFDVGSAAGLANPMLTLGNRITLVGRTEGQHGQTANNTVELVRVRNLNARLIMLAGSRITGHTTSGTGGTVLVERSHFITRGEITGNRSSATATYVVGGVRLIEGSTIRMEVGSRITGNTRGTVANPIPADISISNNTRDFILAGSNIIIGALIINADTFRNPVIYIDDNLGWTGHIAHLELRLNTANLNTVVNTWTGNTIVRSPLRQSTVSQALPQMGNTSRSFVATGSSQPFGTTNHRLALGGQEDGYHIGIVTTW